MFDYCETLTSLNVSNFDTSQALDIGFMFGYCRKISSLNVSNFDTSKVTYMGGLFCGCNMVNSLNVSKFDTSKVEYMELMFSGCNKINSLNVSNFDTSKVKNMNSMFSGCSMLNSLNLSNFDTSKVTNMEGMFNGCSTLNTLNLSNFDTSKVDNMKRMFIGCHLLSSLILSNFETSKVKSMEEMFYNCRMLSILNLSSFNSSKLNDIDYMFQYCYNLEYINLKIAEFNDQISKENVFRYSSQNVLLCTEKEEKLKIFFNKHYIVSCYNKNYEYKCYSNITIVMNNKYICEMCGNNFYMKYNDNNNLNIICFDSKPENYYFDTNQLVYKPCYQSCKTCNIDGNPEEHNCIECKEDYTDEYQISIYKNCYKNTFENNENTIENNENTEKTEENMDNTNRNNEKTAEIKDNTIENAIKNNEDTIGNNGNIIENTYYSNTKLTDVVDNKYSNETIQEIINNLKNEINITDIDKGVDKIIPENNIIVKFTSTLNQENNEDNNITLRLGPCENLLKTKYNISYNDSLYIIQIISEEEGMKIPKIEYEVYYPLYSINNLTKLDLTICQGTKVEISINVIINYQIDKHNASSDYYNDPCYKLTSEDGTDISLKDRRNEFVNNNLSLCEENCELIDYNYTKEKAICSCDVKSNIPEKSDIKFNKNIFMNNFIKKIDGLNVLKCGKIAWKANNLKNNSGFYIIFFIIVLYFITTFIFWYRSFIILKKVIIYIISFFNNPEKIKEVNQKQIKNKNRIKNKQEEEYDSNNINKLVVYTKENETKKENTKHNTNDMISENYLELGGLSDMYIKELNEQKDFEMNSSDYEEALKLDHRNFLQYYISLIKNDHPIMISFAPYNDYNSRIIKIFLFFFSFNICLDLNALFFNNDSIHKIYEDKGKYNFSYQFPQIFYSALITRIVDILIKYLALTQDTIVELKKEKEKKELEINHEKKIKRILKIKFISFFIINFIILVFFWYYVTCFCGIYENTQKHLMINTIVSLIIVELLPFILYLIPGILRIAALRVEKPTRKLLYKLSCFFVKYLR